MEVFNLPAHLYNPLLYLAKGNVEIGISPVALNESEIQFVKALHKHITLHTEEFKNKEIYLIRNRSKKGIGFFDDAGFFPDFILWLIADGKQYITLPAWYGERTDYVEQSRTVQTVENRDRKHTACFICASNIVYFISDKVLRPIR